MGIFDFFKYGIFSKIKIQGLKNCQICCLEPLSSKMAILSLLANLEFRHFGNFWLFQMWNFLKNQNSGPPKLPSLILRKICVAVIILKFPHFEPVLPTWNNNFLKNFLSVKCPASRNTSVDSNQSWTRNQQRNTPHPGPKRRRRPRT